MEVSVNQADKYKDDNALVWVVEWNLTGKKRVYRKTKIAKLNSRGKFEMKEVSFVVMWSVSLGGVVAAECIDAAG